MQTYYIGKNKTKVQIQDIDFLAEGGQAKIYAKKDLVYKVYHDPNTLIPEEKIKELEVLSDIPAVVLPKDQIYDGTGKRMGLVFDWIKDAEPIYNMGSNAYWREKDITSKVATGIVEEIIKTVQKIHERDCLIVDLNPFNILVDQKTLRVHFFIDTEPWQTKNFRAMVIMPGVRDWQNKSFSKLTDYYSLGIVTCEFYLGVHPFKGGVHSRYGPKDMELRMRNNAPIFDKGVRLNSRIRPFDIIPKNYYQWYIDMFLLGKRIPPPTTGGVAEIRKAKAEVGKTVKFEIPILQEYPENIVAHYFRSGKRIIKTKNNVWVDRERLDLIGDVIIVENEPVVVIIEDGRLILKTRDDKIEFDFTAEDFMISDNRIYAKNGAYLNEINIAKIGIKFHASIGQSWDIISNASKLFDELVIQNMLGKPFFVIPGICKNRVDKLIGYKVITARRFGRVIVVIANRDGQDHQMVFIFDKSFENYDCQSESVTTKDINVAILDKLLMVSIPEDGKIDIKSLTLPDRKIMEDVIIKSDWNLSAEENRVVFFLENKLYQLKMRGN